MCGITGWVDWKYDLRQYDQVIENMAGTMACRGPDAQNVWLSARAAIGHRRLAIIDPEGGKQPMSAVVPSGQGIAVLTYSGEIYNFTELRAELQNRGHEFETRSDTEVCLHAYLEWGPAFVRRLNGMYAFAIWDSANQRVFMARDRLGIKPLYYYTYEDGVIFGSEPKAIMANPWFKPVLAAEGLAELFVMFGSHTPGHGVLKGLHEVRPGHTVTVDRNGVRAHRYWQLESNPHTDDPFTTAAVVRDILSDTVTRQLVSDVPLCSLVSGGLGSSAVSALAARSLAAQNAGKLNTFSVDFAGSEFIGDVNRPERDTSYVRALVEHIGSAHTEVSTHTEVSVETPDLLAIQDIATAARDLPSMGDLDASRYLLFKAIQGRSTVALSGESADAVFGGYAWFHDEAGLARNGFPWDDIGFADVLAPDVKARVRPQEYAGDRYAEALTEVPKLDGESPADARRREVNYLGLTRFLPVLLDRKDRMSMAVGLEVRVPFCDHRLVEYTWNVPWSIKYPNGVPKGLLRSAVADLLPPKLVNRRKSLFPVVPSPGYDSAVRSRAKELISGDSAIRPLLDPAKVLDLVEGTSRRPPWMQRLDLAYLNQVENWLRRYKVRVAA